MGISELQPALDRKSSVASRNPAFLEAQRSPSYEGIVEHALAAW